MSSVNVKRVPAAGCSKIFKSNLERSHGSLFQSPPLLQVRLALKCESGCKSDIFELLKAAWLAEVPPAAPVQIHQSSPVTRTTCSLGTTIWRPAVISTPR